MQQPKPKNQRLETDKKMQRNNKIKKEETLEMPWEILKINIIFFKTNFRHKRKWNIINFLSNSIDSKYTQFVLYILQGIRTYVKVVARQKVSVKCTEFNNLYKLLTIFFRLWWIAVCGTCLLVELYEVANRATANSSCILYLHLHLYLYAVQYIVLNRR